MSLEINRNTTYTYRISLIDPRLIERRQNRNRARWQEYRLLPSATEANAALLKLAPKGFPSEKGGG